MDRDGSKRSRDLGLEDGVVCPEGEDKSRVRVQFRDVVWAVVLEKQSKVRVAGAVALDLDASTGNGRSPKFRRISYIEEDRRDVTSASKRVSTG